MIRALTKGCEPLNQQRNTNMTKQFVTTVNAKLSKIYAATNAARSANLEAHSNLVDDYLICKIDKIHRKINLYSPNALPRLDALLRDIYAITPSSVAI